MKNFKESAELQSQQIPQLQEKIKNLEEEIANREKSSAATDEAHQRIIANHQKELNELKEENERLRNEILSANNFVTKSKTPQKSNKIEVLKDYDSPISTSDEKNISAENDSKYSKKIVNMSPQNLNKQMANMCLQQTQSKSTRKKVDLLEETIHPSTIKHTNRRRKKNENGKKEKERETEKKRESESASVKKKGKCYKKLFTDNDFDGLTDLNSSPLEVNL